MRRFFASAVLLAAGFFGGPAAALPPAERLLPRDTLVLVSVASLAELRTALSAASFGRLWNDPALGSLRASWDRAFADASADMAKRAGIGMDQLVAAVDAQATYAAVDTGGGEPDSALILDGGGAGRLKRLVGDVYAAIERSGATPVVLPDAIEGHRAYELVGRRRMRIELFQRDDALLVATNPALMAAMIANLNGTGADMLLDNVRFSAFAKRWPARQLPHLVAYADPVGFVRNLARSQTGMQIAMATLPVIGLDGLDALGGTLRFDAGGLDWRIDAHAFLSASRGGVLDVVAFKPMAEAPEPWVPAAVASYAGFRWDFERSYRSLAKVYDGFNGEGALARVQAERFLKASKVNVAADVLPLLEGRVSWLTMTTTQGDPPAESLVGLRLKDPSRMKAILEQIAAANSQFSRQTAEGREFWQRNEPAAQLAADPAKPPRPAQRQCFGLLDDYLLISDGPAIYRATLATSRKQQSPLVDDIQYKLVASRIGRHAGAARPAYSQFSRFTETAAVLHRAISNESTRKSIAARADREPVMRLLHQTLSGGALPPLETVQAFFAPMGAMIVDDETGLHYTAFALKRTSP